MSLASEPSTPGTQSPKPVSEEEKQQIALEWKEEQEDILKEWAEKAMCYRWLHHRSHMKYRKKNMLYTIPVIVISTLTGTANFALDRFDEASRQIAVMIIGGLNLTAGIISTVAQFLKISEINEGHRVASIAWDKFYRNVKLELSKSPKDRRHPGEMLKLSKEEYDRLIETSPMIQEDVIRQFKRSFNLKELKNEDIRLPEILDELESVNRYDRSKDIIIPVKSKVEISKSDILSKLKDVLDETKNKNPLQPLDLKKVTEQVHKKMSKEIELSRKYSKKIRKSPKENDDFVIELKPQVKSSHTNSMFIKSPPHPSNVKKLSRKPSFNIGARASQLEEMEEESSSDSENNSIGNNSHTFNRNSPQEDLESGISAERSSFDENENINSD